MHPVPQLSGPRFPLMTAAILSALVCVGCIGSADSQRVRPRRLADVPAQRLAYTFRADTEVPPAVRLEESANKLEPIAQDFDARRPNDALLRTVTSPDGQRALALYGTIDEPGPAFHIDLYASDGKFLRNLTPANLAGVFADSVMWSPNGELIAFVGRKHEKPVPTPTPLPELEELPTPSPSPSALPTPSATPPAFGLRLFSTEQVYLCNRDGFDLKALTTREGLIYFALSWSPDNSSLAALACRESEWNAREREFKSPAGRPRIISIDAQERLLDDAMAEAPPVWSPDSSKIATAFGTDVGIYDAASKAPSQARINLRQPLLAASILFDERSAKPVSTPGKNAPSQPATVSAGEVPASFNPIVRLEWPEPEKLYLETAYVSIRGELIKTWSRWHLLTLSAQAAVLGR